MSYPYFRFFPGDYLRDTYGLSLAQHGAYCLLLMHYYSRGKALEGSLEDILKLLPIRTRHDRAAALYCTTRFFISTEGVWRQQRADRELQRMSHVSDKAVDSAKKRWSEGNANAHANALRPQSHIDLDLEPELDKPRVTLPPTVTRATPQPNFEKGKKANGSDHPRDAMWDRDESLTDAKARELGLYPAKQGEGWEAYRSRIRAAIAERQR